MKPASLDFIYDKVKNIRKSVMMEDQKLRQRYGILRKQSMIGAGILLVVVFSILGTVALYFLDSFSWWLAVLSIAFFMSIAHELEHDLVHDLYFHDRKWVQKWMLGIIWIIKFHSNPFWRRAVHIRHHAYSGQVEDWEERLLGLGDRFGLKRILVTIMPFGQILYLREVQKTDPKFNAREALQKNLVPGILYNILLVIGMLSIFAADRLLTLTTLEFVSTIQNIFLLWIVPSWIRYVALTLATTLCHYAGDIDYQAVGQENQIVYHWATLPLAIFSANFAATHIIHHYFAPQPFYIRFLIAPRVIPVMIKHGCRYNDLGILGRYNRYHENPRRCYGFGLND